MAMAADPERSLATIEWPRGPLGFGASLEGVPNRQFTVVAACEVADGCAPSAIGVLARVLGKAYAAAREVDNRAEVVVVLMESGGCEEEMSEGLAGGEGVERHHTRRGNPG